MARGMVMRGRSGMNDGWMEREEMGCYVGG